MKTVMLIGDSIRIGYQDGVYERLAGRAHVHGPSANGGTSRNILEHMDEWLGALSPDIVHVNCGLHDLKREFGSEVSAVPLDEYAENVRSILRRLKKQTSAAVAWALTTPVNQEWHHKNKPFDRFEADVMAYNLAAAAAADELSIPVNDLFAVVMKNGRDELLQPDGVHFKPTGCELLAEQVSGFIVCLLEKKE